MCGEHFFFRISIPFGECVCVRLLVRRSLTFLVPVSTIIVAVVVLGIWLAGRLLCHLSHRWAMLLFQWKWRQNPHPSTGSYQLYFVIYKYAVVQTYAQHSHTRTHTHLLYEQVLAFYGSLRCMRNSCKTLVMINCVINFRKAIRVHKTSNPTTYLLKLYFSWHIEVLSEQCWLASCTVFQVVHR